MFFSQFFTYYLFFDIFLSSFQKVLKYFRILLGLNMFPFCNTIQYVNKKKRYVEEFLTYENIKLFRMFLQISNIIIVTIKKKF